MDVVIVISKGSSTPSFLTVMIDFCITTCFMADISCVVFIRQWKGALGNFCVLTPDYELGLRIC